MIQLLINKIQHYILVKLSVSPNYIYNCLFLCLIYNTMTLYLAFKFLTCPNHQLLRQNDSILTLTCASTQTGLKFTQKISSEDPSLGATIQLDRNGFVGPEDDTYEIRLTIRSIDDDDEKQNVFEKVLDLKQREAQKKKNEIFEYVTGEGKLLLWNEFSQEKHTLGYKFKIKNDRKYCGIAPYLPKNINESFKSIKLMENTGLTDLTEQDLEEGIKIYRPQFEESFEEPQFKKRRIYIPESLVNRGINSGINQELEILKDSPQKSNQPKKNNIDTGVYANFIKGHKQKVVFYSGPCRSKNMFSCLDVDLVEQELNLIEPYYSQEK